MSIPQTDFYQLAMDVSGAIGGPLMAYLKAHDITLAELPPLLKVRRGYAESPAWFLVQADEFHPEPLTVANVRVRDIYASERIVQALLEMLVGEKWLMRQGEAYHLTPDGLNMIEFIKQRLRPHISQLEPMPADALARLEQLLARLMDASLNSSLDAWCLRYSRRRAPSQESAPLVHIFQYFADFNAFRDDAHMAAWQPHEPRGYVWEAFSFIWDGSAKTAEEIYHKLIFRGYSVDEYGAALDELVARGWLTKNEDGYQATAVGRTLREAVEAQTNAYFYEPWAVLTSAEIEELEALLNQLKQGFETSD